jgi:hypothetical protein
VLHKSRPPHLGLQTARNFSSKSALDVALNTPVGFRAIVDYTKNTDKKSAHKRPARRVRRVPSKVSSTVGTIPSDVSLFESFVRSDIFPRRQPERRLRFTVVFEANPPQYLSVLTRSTVQGSGLTFSLDDFMHIKKLREKHQTRLINALQRLRMLGVVGDEAVWIDDGQREVFRVDIDSRYNRQDIRQALGLYEGDPEFFEVVEWGALDAEEEVVGSRTPSDRSTSTVALLEESPVQQDSDEWLMPRLDVDVSPLPISSDLAQSVADTVYSPSLSSFSSPMSSHESWSEASS